ncbi:hypothetical protein ACQJBY_003395 [Aegilops geniculata]
MEPTGPSTKRMRPAPPDIHQSTPGPAETADPEATAAGRTQHPLPGAGRDGGEGSPDRISDLPDAVLGEIIFLLPTKDGARTQALASRWRHIWRAAPLNLDCRGLSGNLPGAIISAHGGPVHRLCLPSLLLQYRADVAGTWLRSPSLDKLQELEFYLELPITYIFSFSRFQLLQPPPASIFRFSSTLRVATISQCHLPDNTVETLQFPLLKKLALVEVKISEGSLQSIISSGCPALESLLLRTSFDIRGLRINSPILKSIGVHSRFVELIIEVAPSLERLLCLRMDMRMRVSVISAPRLATLGYISQDSQDSKIMFGSTVIQRLLVVSLTMVVPTIKILAVHMNFNLDMVIELLKCFVCLEKLYMKIQTDSPAGTNFWRHKHRNFLTSQDISLKTLVLGHYRGIQAQVNFVTFFILNAKLLESIRLEVDSRDYNDGFFAEQCRMLQMERRVSRGAQLCVTTGSHNDVSSTIDLSDLDLADPFACRC